MKTLFKDEIISKFRKLPNFMWYAFLAISYFFKNAYVIIADAKSMTGSYMEAFAEMGITGFNGTAFAVIVGIFVPIFFTLIFELFIRIIYGIIARRFALAVNQSDFCFRVRLVIIVANCIIGIVNILLFFLPQLVDLMNAIFSYAVPTLLLAWFYEDFRARYVPKRNHATLFSYVAKFYVGIYLIFSAFDLLYYFLFFNGQVSVIATVSLCVDTVIIIATAVLAYLNYKRLIKIALEPEDNNLFIKKEEKPKDDSIFKDFGF